MQDPEKFDVIAKEVIRRGYCKADTVEIKIESVVYKDSVIEKIERIPCADFDTTIGRARISVRSGVLTYSYRDSVIKQTIIRNIRDLAAEDVLRGDVANRDSVINVLQKDILGLRIANGDQRDETRKWKWRFWGLVGLLGLIGVGRIVIKLL